MAFVKCTKCGKNISDKAYECPHCEVIISQDTSDLIADISPLLSEAEAASTDRTDKNRPTHEDLDDINGYVSENAQIATDKPSEETKKCPFCAEAIKAEAILCRYCKKDLPLTLAPIAEVNRYKYQEVLLPPAPVGQAFLQGGMIGFFYLVIGGLLMLVPVIGWIVGPTVIIMGILGPNIVGFIAIKNKVIGKTTKVGRLTGPCPYCDTELTATLGIDVAEAALDCSVCKKQFLIRNKQFFPIK